MLRSLIEQTRKDMFLAAKDYGMTSPTTVHTSQVLDHLLNLYYQKFQQKTGSREMYVHGSVIQNILDGSLKYQSDVLQDLKKFDLLSKSTSEWHLLRDFHSIFTHLGQVHGQHLLLDIGLHVPKNCIFPKSLDSFEKGLLELHGAYKLNHSEDVEGFYEVIPYDKHTYFLICNTPTYPAFFNYGLLVGLARKFQTEIRIEQDSLINGGEFKIQIISNGPKSKGVS